MASPAGKKSGDKFGNYDRDKENTAGKGVRGVIPGRVKVRGQAPNKVERCYPQGDTSTNKSEYQNPNTKTNPN